MAIADGRPQMQQQLLKEPFHPDIKADSIANQVEAALVYGEKELDSKDEIEAAICSQQCSLNIRSFLMSSTLLQLIDSVKRSAKRQLPPLLLDEEADVAGRVSLKVSSETLAAGLHGHLHQLERSLRLRQLPGDGESRWQRCKQLKYYKPRSASQRSLQPTEAHTLRFSDRPFSKSNLPPSIPDRISDMKQESNRLSSYNIPGKRSFSEVCSFIKIEELAAEGFFYMQIDDKVKCAFCLGVLASWQQGETPQEAHRLHFSTCPMVLGLEVGNVPIVSLDAGKEAECKQPSQCTEECSDDTAAFWMETLQSGQLPALAPARSAEWTSEQEALYQSSRGSVFPVSPERARDACNESSVENLQLLTKTLQLYRSDGCYRPASPEFAEIGARVGSIAEESLAVPSDLLADAGFFVSNGHCRCYWCDLDVLAWRDGDDPWVEHARWSPRCGHVLLSRGDQFVLAVRAAHPPYQPLAASLCLPLDPSEEEQQQEQEQEQPLLNGSSSLVEYRIEQRHFKAREDFPSALSIRQLGFDADDVKTAMVTRLKTRGDDFRSQEQFLSNALRVQAERLRLGVSARQYHEEKMKELETSRREPREFMGDELDWTACKVCMDKVINVTLLECGHLCCCSQCVRQLENCPVCRAPIKATVYINL